MCDAEDASNEQFCYRWQKERDSISINIKNNEIDYYQWFHSICKGEQKK